MISFKDAAIFDKYNDANGQTLKSCFIRQVPATALHDCGGAFRDAAVFDKCDHA